MDKKPIFTGIVVLGIAVILVVLLASSALNNKISSTSNTSISNSSPKSQNQTSKPSNPAIDTPIDSLLQAYDDETKIIEEENSDANFVTNDSAIINSFGEAYNENTF